MNWKDYNLFHIFLSLLLTAAILFFGQALWHSYAVAKPLDKVLQDINGVEQVTWHEKSRLSEIATIDITLKNADNFASTYAQIEEAAKQILGHNGFQIKINDHRTVELEQLYYTVHYYLQEAIATGNFSLMNERVQQKVTQQGAAADIYVNANYIYLKLAKGNDDMYVLIPRQSTIQEAKNNALY